MFLFLIISLAYAQESERVSHKNSAKKLIFFSNDGCGKCTVSQNFFDANNMPYEKLAIRENRPLMYEYVNKKSKGKHKGVGYPILVYGDSIYFSIKNMNKTLEEIKTMMIEDGLIEKADEKDE